MLSQCTPVYWVIMWPCRWHAFRLKAIAVLLYCSSQPFVRLHPDGSRRDWRMWWWCTVREAWHALGLWYLAFSFISKYVPPLKVCDSVARHDHICILCKLMVLWMLQFFPTAEESMKFYNQKRCVDSKGLHIPSQLVSSHSDLLLNPESFLPFLSFECDCWYLVCDRVTAICEILRAGIERAERIYPNWAEVFILLTVRFCTVSSKNQSSYMVMIIARSCLLISPLCSWMQVYHEECPPCKLPILDSSGRNDLGSWRYLHSLRLEYMKLRGLIFELHRTDDDVCSTLSRCSVH